MSDNFGSRKVSLPICSDFQKDIRRYPESRLVLPSRLRSSRLPFAMVFSIVAIIVMIIVLLFVCDAIVVVVIIISSSSSINYVTVIIVIIMIYLVLLLFVYRIPHSIAHTARVIPIAPLILYATCHITSH